MSKKMRKATSRHIQREIPGSVAYAEVLHKGEYISVLLV
jgi:hypothetical protein